VSHLASCEPGPSNCRPSSSLLSKILHTPATLDVGLSRRFAFGSYFLCDPSHFGSATSLSGSHVLMVSCQRRKFARTSTVILLDRSPRATAVVTSRNVGEPYSSKVRSHPIHESVRSFSSWTRERWLAADFTFGAHSLATRVTSSERTELVTIRVEWFPSMPGLARTSTVILRDKSPARPRRTSAILRTWTLSYRPGVY